MELDPTQTGPLNRRKFCAESEVSSRVVSHITGGGLLSNVQIYLFIHLSIFDAAPIISSFTNSQAKDVCRRSGKKVEGRPVKTSTTVKPITAADRLTMTSLADSRFSHSQVCLT